MPPGAGQVKLLVPLEVAPLLTLDRLGGQAGSAALSLGDDRIVARRLGTKHRVANDTSPEKYGKGVKKVLSGF